MHKPNKHHTAAVNKKEKNNDKNNKQDKELHFKVWISTVILFVGDCKVVRVSESLSLSVSGAWPELDSPHS